MKRHLNIKKMSKPLALIIAALMIVTLVPVSFMFAMARGEGEHSHDNQIVYSGGTLSYDENGKPTTGDDWAVSVSKTITATGNENEFEITLEVKTTEDIEDLDISPDTAVVLTIDISGSMAYNAAGSSTTVTADKRMNIAKDAAIEFINSYAASANGAKRYISVVVFGLTAQVIQPWINVGEGADSTAINDVKGQIYKIQDSTRPNSGALNDVFYLENGTFIQGGLILTRNLYANGTLGASVDNRFVILLTDGNPNCWTTDAGRVGNYNNITKLQQNNATVSEDATGWRNARPYATPIAKDIREGVEGSTMDARMYTIAYNTAATNVGPDTDGFTGSAAKWLSDKIAYNDTYAKTATTDLSEIFQTINTNIARWAEAWTVTDPMGTDIVYTGDRTAQTAPVSFENNTLVWDLKKDGSSKKENGVTTFTYTYPVTLDTLANGFSAGNRYETNGKTTLTYVIDMAVDHGAPVQLGELHTVDFKIPKVKGFAGSLAFTKVGSNDPDNGLSGFRFKLESEEKDASGAPRYVRYATSDESGAVNFYRIPSGHSYTLTEVRNPAHALYSTGEAITGISVSYGHIRDIINGGQFVNDAKDVTITLHKFFESLDESFRSFSRPSYTQELECELEEHTHDDSCYYWEDPNDPTATSSSLNEGWVKVYTCGFAEDYDHTHNGPCYVFTLMDNDDPEFTFTFTLTDKNGDQIGDEVTITLKKSEILALMESNGFYTNDNGDPITFTIPASKIGNGPFTITETSNDEYTGWELSGPITDITLSRKGPTPAVEMLNEFGGVRRPRFTVTKNLEELRNDLPDEDNLFDFDLYDNGNLIKTFSLKGSERTTIRLDDYLNANASLTLVERIPSDEDAIPGMQYDTNEYTIEIRDGRVVSINEAETNHVSFTNTYVSPLYSIMVEKQYSGHALPDDFYITVEGPDEYVRVLTPDPEDESCYIDDENGIICWYLFELEKGVYTAKEENYEVSGYDWEGKDSDSATVPNENNQFGDDFDATLNLVNKYSYTPPPPPPQDNYGSISITKNVVVEGGSVPANYDATFTVTGPGGYNRTLSYANDFTNGSIRLNNLTLGNYTVTETSAMSIDGYNWSVNYSAANGAVTVVANQTANVAITNTYWITEVPPPPPPPPPYEEVVLGDEDVPLAAIEPEPEPEIEDVMIDEDDVPRGEMPQTGIQDTIGLWIFSLCLAMMSVVVLTVIVKKTNKNNE